MIAGIIAEYNPFHNGHQYHLHQTKAIEGVDGVVVAMSQDITQRGNFSSFDKWWRTQKALENGADLVIGLPYAVSAQSAEYFAKGAVSLLNQCNIDLLSFGAETADLASLEALSEALLQGDKDFKGTLKKELRSGLSYPLAREKAVSILYPNLNAALLKSPNNILAIEYLKAVKDKELSLKMHPVERIGAGYHDTEASFADLSASGIRNALKHGLINIDKQAGLPYSIEELRSKFFPVNEDKLFTSIMEKLILSTSEDLSSIAGITEDTANRLLKLKGQVKSFGDIITALNSKEMTYTAVSRMLMNLLMNFKKEDLNSYYSKDYSPFIRVLGFNRRGREILRDISAPKVVNLGKNSNSLDIRQKEVLRKDIQASNMRGLFLELNEYNQDYYSKPVIVSEEKYDQ